MEPRLIHSASQSLDEAATAMVLGAGKHLYRSSVVWVVHIHTNKKILPEITPWTKSSFLQTDDNKRNGACRQDMYAPPIDS